MIGRTKTPGSQRATRLGLERLEARQLLTIVASTNGNLDSASLVAAGGPGAGGTFGYVNVGDNSTHSASVIYLGNRWCLTAAHVSIDNALGTIRFGPGTAYQVDMSTITTVLNTDNSPADLRLFQLTTDPGLPTILPSQIVSSTPTGRQIMIGNGLSTDTQHYWHISTATNPWTWTEQSPPLFPGPNDVTGFGTVDGREIRWGENTFDSTFTLTNGSVVSKGYTTVFDNLKYTGVAPLASECQGSVGDSGGAVYTKEGGVWKLGGVIDAVSGDFSGQPANTIIFGSGTFIIDLSQYRTQILNMISGVTSRHLFYAGSAWDVTNANLPGFSDDNAIAPDKTAYLPGTGGSTFSSVSSYTRGINGVMVDLYSAHGTITANDFTFKVGNNNSPGSWTTAPAPTLVTTRAGAGTGGSDRVGLFWADGAIQGSWLEVIVRGKDTLGGSNANTGLAASDVFYFGSATADSGAGDTGGYAVNSSDEQSARNDPHGLGNPATITNVNDFNRDTFVNSTDQTAPRNFASSLITMLKFLNVGAGGPFAPSTDAIEPSAGDLGIACAVLASMVMVGAGLPSNDDTSMPLFTQAADPVSRAADADDTACFASTDTEDDTRLALDQDSVDALLAALGG